MSPGEMMIWASEFVAARRRALSTPPDGSYHPDAQQARDRWLADAVVGACDEAWGVVNALRDAELDVRNAFGDVGDANGVVSMRRAVLGYPTPAPQPRPDIKVPVAVSEAAYRLDRDANEADVATVVRYIIEVA